MMLLILLTALVAISNARPNGVPKNVVTVPPNCPPGQVFINGQCRDLWRILQLEIQSSGSAYDFGALSDDSAEDRSVVTVPANCPPGQQYMLGQCRDIWTGRNVVTVPPNCPVGQAWINDACRDVWALSRVPIAAESSNTQDPLSTKLDNTQTYNIISVPNQCAAGYRPDANGICRPIF